MKKAFVVLSILGTILMTSCGVHLPLTSNLNQQITNVELGEGNFKVVKTVAGEAQAQYILGFGGLKKRSLIESAKKQMVEAAELEGKSRALVNVSVEEYIQNYVLVIRRKVVVTGQVVEFN